MSNRQKLMTSFFHKLMPTARRPTWHARLYWKRVGRLRFPVLQWTGAAAAASVDLGAARWKSKRKTPILCGIRRRKHEPRRILHSRRVYQMGHRGRTDRNGVSSAEPRSIGCGDCLFTTGSNAADRCISRSKDSGIELDDDLAETAAKNEKSPGKSVINGRCVRIRKR